MNELLKNLYSSKWGKINEMLQSFNEDDPEDLENLATHPLLIKTDDEYAKADLKVMFFGQETNEWNGVFEEYADLESVLAVYEDFISREVMSNMASLFGILYVI